MSVLGRIRRISGSLVVAEDMAGIKMYEVVEVGEEGLIGEVSRIEGDVAYIQVYESTSGLRPGEIVKGTGNPLSVELGPGLISQIYDGIQRPLEDVKKLSNSIFVKRGIRLPALPREKKWHFKPIEQFKHGSKVSGGTIIGTVKESELIEHRIMVPPNIHGVLKELSPEGDYNIEEEIGSVEQDGKKIPLKLYHTWPVRIPRPYQDKLEPNEPLVTGLRIIDTLFPIAKGGTAAIPGGFGTGKTVTLHGLAQWSEAKVVIYIGCGERGNEMTEVLERFPEYKDPWTGRPLMERTILIANTSNMPVAAREASIYVGVTMAEYYRDQGYDVLLVADSTSRWAEALREIAGRLEEMPAEEGYPSYLASRIAEFYERAGRVIAAGDPRRIGSVTIGGAVSPPGGDFTEPVTSHTRRFVRVFWALDTALAYSRHYPAINWLISYSAYADTVSEWWKKNVDSSWSEDRKRALEILYRENEVREIVRLVGTEGLSESDKLILFTARLLKDGFLKQNAFDPIDAFSEPRRQYKMLRSILTVHEAISALILQKGVTMSEVEGAISDPVAKLVRGRYTIPHDRTEEFDKIVNEILKKLEELQKAR
ncbi:MAG TPA: V-type ATP synthase subunit A [Fervidicoccus fontis]|uniref:A-type ATP synthase subunit A n=1 Tax=Fervidicoccus fontis TaxID=683846 RepID=A0A7C2ULG9_9CREN|nr:MAG: V-type ATP synthase subunit A [Fervidicoccus sp.]HEU97869.1 V-type ATP synthase subunit A [Fervidicoccus fontis]